MERMRMSTRPHDGWPLRLAFCFAGGATVVVFSALTLLLLTLQHPPTALHRLFYVVIIPLLPGMGVVSTIWGSWRAIHQGRILFLVPLFSFIINTVLLFVIWEFFHIARARELASDSKLHIN